MFVTFDVLQQVVPNIFQAFPSLNCFRNFEIPPLQSVILGYMNEDIIVSLLHINMTHHYHYYTFHLISDAEPFHKIIGANNLSVICGH